MIFTSLSYLFFFALIVILYFSIKQKYRWILLLIGSYYFYMSWKAEYALLLIATTLVDYIAARRLEHAQHHRGIILGISLAFNLGILATFKYWNFFSDAIRDTLTAFSIPFTPLTIKLLLPIGISFYTFQSLSYIIDVYRKKITPEHHLGIYATYISFFPQLVSGPIERAGHLLPQFREKHTFNYQRTVDGLKFIIWGFFKKLVVADQLSIVVSAAYADPTNVKSSALLFATIAFAIQIYCDFSGYTDIARGSAQILGFSLVKNFNWPYLAESIPDFWRRWHISLSDWFRDYLYIPLGGNRVNIPWHCLHLLIVFLVCGLWHGAKWTFIIWGLIHGIYMIIHYLTKSLRKHVINFTGLDRHSLLKQTISVFLTFCMVSYAWIFFRANTLTDARYIATHLFSFSEYSNILPGQSIALLAFILTITALFLITYIFIEISAYIAENKGTLHLLSTTPTLFRRGIFLLLIIAILLYGVFETRPFIYLQF